MLRFTTAELDIIDHAAAAEHMLRAAWMRTVLLRAATRAAVQRPGKRMERRKAG